MTRRLGGVAALLLLTAVALSGWAPAQASSSVTLDGSFFRTITKPENPGNWRCPAGTANECGVMQFAGLGPADYSYDYGPKFDPNGTKGCFDIDGTFAITLQSDHSTTSGPLVGVFCGPGNSHQQAGTPAYGNPFSENDTIQFAGGNGQFAGLSGAAAFHQQSAGAEWRGRLTGTLNG
jgi:hypothetical protein